MLKSRVQERNIPDLELDRTVAPVMRSTVLLEGNEVVYEALDTDHHGHPLREADLRLQRYRERLPDKLVLKVGARVV